MTALRRRKPYPRVVFDDGFHRVTFTDRSEVRIEQRSYDVLDEPIWVPSDVKLATPPEYFTKKLLNRLLTIARRKSRRRTP